MRMVEQKFVKMQERFTKIWSLPRVNIDLLHAQSLDEKDDILTVSTVIEVPKTFSIEHDAKQHEECESLHRQVRFNDPQFVVAQWL
jgi:hypothetical protein